MARAEPLPLIINLQRNQLLIYPLHLGKMLGMANIFILSHLSHCHKPDSRLDHLDRLRFSRRATGEPDPGVLVLGFCCFLTPVVDGRSLPIRVRVAGAKTENFGPKKSFFTIKMTFCKDLVGRQNLLPPPSPHNPL